MPFKIYAVSATKMLYLLLYSTTHLSKIILHNILKPIYNMITVNQLYCSVHVQLTWSCRPSIRSVVRQFHSKYDSSAFQVVNSLHVRHSITCRCLPPMIPFCPRSSCGYHPFSLNHHQLVHYPSNRHRC